MHFIHPPRLSAASLDIIEAFGRGQAKFPAIESCIGSLVWPAELTEGSTLDLLPDISAIGSFGKE
jgi:hypothetical protein